MSFNRRHFGPVALGLAAAVQAGPSLAQSTPASTWEQIRSTRKIRMGAVQYPPYWNKPITGGEWTGAMVEIGKGIAKTLNVEMETVETTWNTFPLDLNANRIDMMLALSATPERAMAIDFVGPFYQLTFTLLNNPQFKATTWADYNKPEVRISVLLGGSGDVALKRFAPKAQRIRLAQLGETILAVKADRADTVMTTTIAGLMARARNPELGEFVVPTPVVPLPSYAALRYDQDRRLHEFLYWWAEWNRGTGDIEDWIRASLQGVGVTEIPDNVRF